MLSVEVVVTLGLAPSAGQPGRAPVGQALGGGAAGCWVERVPPVLCAPLSQSVAETVSQTNPF